MISPHIFGLQAFLAELIALGVRCHLRMDTGVISAG